MIYNEISDIPQNLACIKCLVNVITVHYGCCSQVRVVGVSLCAFSRLSLDIGLLAAVVLLGQVTVFTSSEDALASDIRETYFCRSPCLPMCPESELSEALSGIFFPFVLKSHYYLVEYIIKILFFSSLPHH